VGLIHFKERYSDCCRSYRQHAVSVFRLEIEEEGQYENCPSDNRPSSLSALFYPLMQPVEMAHGGTLTVYGSHDRRSLRV
jgi:hypothetical protein